MVEISIKHKKYNYNSAIGALVCRTPKVTKTYNDITNEYETNYCKLVTSTDELLTYFGDPFVSPKDYPELAIAYDIVSKGLYVYISSLDDTKTNVDDFITEYNGYTEFVFSDDAGYASVGYNLKSKLKFCQPLIRLIEYDKVSKILNLYVSIYVLDRDSVKAEDDLDRLDSKQLYKTQIFSYKVTDDLTDADLIADFDANDLELQVTNKIFGDERCLLSKFIQYEKFEVDISNKLIGDIGDKSLYKLLGYCVFNLHSDDYLYSINGSKPAIEKYREAIDRTVDLKPEPHLLCLSRLVKAKEIKNNKGRYIRVATDDLDPEYYYDIHSYLLECFPDSCDVYLFINSPNISSFTFKQIITSNNSYKDYTVLQDQFNCELSYGYSNGFLNNALSTTSYVEMPFSASLLSFYASMVKNIIYSQDLIAGLNIPNESLTPIITERTARLFADNRCNSMVNFVTGSASLYGNRTLSTKPNLRYSNIARNFVRIRRLIKEYLETQKFEIKTVFNIQSNINHISYEILDKFKSSGVLLDYNIKYSTFDRQVDMTIVLIFAKAAETITVSFSI